MTPEDVAERILNWICFDYEQNLRMVTGQLYQMLNEEREACAKICEQMCEDGDGAAGEIRARGIKNGS